MMMPCPKLLRVEGHECNYNGCIDRDVKMAWVGIIMTFDLN